MGKTYTTIQGETWDGIAYKIYGGEKYATDLMAANYRYLDILVFSSGTVLTVPDLPEEGGQNFPEWRTSTQNKNTDPYDII